MDLYKALKKSEDMAYHIFSACEKKVNVFFFVFFFLEKCLIEILTIL